jgi:hypothetical protein
VGRGDPTRDGQAEALLGVPARAASMYRSHRMAIELRRQSTTFQVWEDSRGALRIETPHPLILVYRARGHLARDFVEPFIESVETALADGRPHLFWDGTEMVGYDSDFRKQIGAYCVRVKGRVEAMNVYTPSRMVAMGASVINIWLGGFFSMLKSAEAFQLLLDETRYRLLSQSAPPSRPPSA